MNLGMIADVNCVGNNSNGLGEYRRLRIDANRKMARVSTTPTVLKRSKKALQIHLFCNPPQIAVGSDNDSSRKLTLRETHFEIINPSKTICRISAGGVKLILAQIGQMGIETKVPGQTKEKLAMF
jgi:hypothetical protein